MPKGTVLVIGSNATQIELRGGGSANIGQYLNETVVPVMALIEAGYGIVLATPDGSKPPIDQASDSAAHFGGDDAAYARGKSFYVEHPTMNQVQMLRSVIDRDLGAFAGVFVPGGHAPAVDLMQDADVGAILRHCHDAAKPTALICHAPVAVAAAMPDARGFRAALMAGDTARTAEIARGWIYGGYKMTVFSASEEKAAEAKLLKGELFFDMPQALRAAGALVSTHPTDATPNVVMDRELITGQNPTSDHLIAATLVDVLDRSTAA